MYKEIKATGITFNVTTEEDFWNRYLRLMQLVVPKSMVLNDKEFNIMVMVLCADPYKNQFRGTGAMKIKDKLNLSMMALSHGRSRLVTKKWIYKEEDSSDVLVIRTLREIQIKVKDMLKLDDKVKMTIPFVFKINLGDE
jgi:hypothetical protein